MNLKDFIARRTGESELYWALVLEPGWIQAGIWEITPEKAEVISMSSGVAWEEEDGLIGAADSALSSAVQSLSEEAGEPSKTVFCVPPSWVSEGSIKPEYLDKIKKLCNGLSLEPKGFVVLPEAIAHLVKSEEGGPLNAIVVGIAKENLDVTIFRLGNLVGTTSVARSVSLVDDVSEGLTRFTSSEPLPSRFIIYDGKEGELSEARDALTQADWETKEKINFLHTPKVEILSPEKKILATALAGASEIANISLVETRSESEETEHAPSPEELGFVVGKDIGPEPTLPPQSFKPQEFLNKGRSVFSLILPKISGLAQSIKLPKGRGGLVLGGAALALLLIGLILWLFIPKATITIFVSPKKIQETTKITLDPKVKSADLGKGIIPASILKTDVSGEKTKSTSGTKKVGDRAKGTVKIRNGTGDVINLPARTILVAANDLKFTLDKDASISGAISPGNPGTTEADVTAGDIGAEYNLAKDESLKVGSYPKAEVDAVVNSDFSGGASREISAVSADDQKTLENDLTSELKDKGKNDLTKDLPPDKFFVEDTLEAISSSKTFDAKVGDEASNLKLSLSLKVSGHVVDKKDLFDLAKGALKGKVPTGYVLRENQLEFNFKDSKVTITANLLPEIKPDEIAKKMRGRYVTGAESYLSAIPGFTRAEITIKPKFPGRLGIIPFFVRNITVEVEKEQ